MRALLDYIDSLSIISTHEHHRPFPPDEEGSLEFLFANSYVAWCGVEFQGVSNREKFLDLVSGNSYFVWYEKALDDLFEFGGKITLRNWDSISEKIRCALSEREFHERVFWERCHFTRAIQDSQWDPGGDNGRPDLYAPAFRISNFLFAHHPDARDHNGNNAQQLYGVCEDLDEYLAMADRVISEMKAKGCVCLKFAAGSRHPMQFQLRSRSAAEKIFGTPPASVTPTEVAVFADFMFDQICLLAAKHNLPLQCHTGLGRPNTSHPMNLIPVIEAHPETKFVIFHGGYPWIEEVAALTHNYSNVYVDMCILPTLCTSAAVRYLHSLIEAARDSSRITWGGDCCYVTESYGAAIAMRYVLKTVLSEKVTSGYLDDQRARSLAERILSINAENLYGLPRVQRNSV